LDLNPLPTVQLWLILLLGRKRCIREQTFVVALSKANERSDKKKRKNKNKNTDKTKGDQENKRTQNDNKGDQRRHKQKRGRPKPTLILVLPESQKRPFFKSSS
jgi:hypothetical protein